MTLVLDEKLTLRFEGVRSVQARKGELVIGPFQRLRFDWEDFGDAAKRGAREYSSGEVRIVSS